MTLVEFLLARITEDETGAKALIERDQATHVTSYFLSFLPGRTLSFGEWLLAECEAKRRIIELHMPNIDGDCIVCIQDSSQIQDLWVQEQTPCRTLRFLAASYSGHPDYREEWKP